MAAKMPDSQELEHLLTGAERVVLADRGYDYSKVHRRIATPKGPVAVALRRLSGQRKGLGALRRPVSLPNCLDQLFARGHAELPPQSIVPPLAVSV